MAFRKPTPEELAALKAALADKSRSNMDAKTREMLDEYNKLEVGGDPLFCEVPAGQDRVKYHGNLRNTLTRYVSKSNPDGTPATVGFSLNKHPTLARIVLLSKVATEAAKPESAQEAPAFS